MIVMPYYYINSEVTVVKEDASKQKGRGNTTGGERRIDGGINTTIAILRRLAKEAVELSCGTASGILHSQLDSAWCVATTDRNVSHLERHVQHLKEETTTDVSVRH